jgi:hypothetical protein
MALPLLLICYEEMPRTPQSLAVPRRNRRWTHEGLRIAVASKMSLAGVLRDIGLRPSGGNYESVGRVIRSCGFSTQHWTGSAHLRGRHNPHVPKIPLARLLVRNSTYHSNKLRRRLIAEGIREARCASCGSTEWLGRAIPLELDHIDGDRTNNLLCNLRLVCPNCHALTPTYRGRNIALRRKGLAARQ